MSARSSEHGPENKESRKGDDNNDASSNLSNAVFNNPKDFLQVLKDHHKEIVQRDNDFASKQDYFYAAENAKDPAVRAAADIAYKHFDDLAKFGVVAPIDNVERPSGVNSVAIDRAMKYLSGNYKSTPYWEEAKNVGLTAFAALGTVAMGALTAISTEAPPVAYIFGASTVIIGGMTGMSSYETYNYPSQMRARAEDTRNKLQSWPEINKIVGRGK